MKRIICRGKSLISVLLIALMMLQFCLPLTAFAAGESIIHISTVKDLKQFADHCRRDNWSKGKAVYLDNDLDLPDSMTLVIASFAGSFDGGGHTISNVSISEAGSNTGFFGIVLKNGVVSHLNIEGKYKPQGVMSRLGGIAGTNYGTIENCTYNGKIKADSELGGIVGRNKESGVVSGCEVSGTIEGNTSCGGVVGYNEGRVVGCTNKADVNVKYEDKALTEEELSNTIENIVMGESLNSLRGLNTRMDVGGVVGFSGGEVFSCVNTGTVGYDHVGYNTGGIVGRSTGFVRDCTNRGTIYGRKDIGGIVGQQQPWLVIDFDEGDLGELNNQVKTLGDMINSTLTDVSGYSAETTQRLLDISNMANAAVDNMEDITDMASDGAGDLSDTAQGTIDTGRVTVDDVNDYVDEVMDALDDVDDELESEEAKARLSSSERAALHKSIEDVKNALNAKVKVPLGELVDNPNVQAALIKALGLDMTSEEGQAAAKLMLNKIREVVATLDIPDSTNIPNIDQILTSLSAAVSQTDSVVSKLSGINSGGIHDAVDDLQDVLDDDSGIYDDMMSILDTADTFNSQVSDLNEDLQNAGTDLYATLGHITDEINETVNAVNGDVQGSISSMKSIQAQGDRIREKVDSMLKKAMDPDTYTEGHTEDVSAEDVDGATDGRTSHCTNEGKIDADNNVGGITGMMGFELDLDPEDDIEKKGSNSFDYVLRTKCIVDRSTNRGEIEVNRNAGGGIVGRMELGLVTNCESYGDVTVEDDFAGGICGYSSSEIADSYTKQYVSGTRYVGGIVGYGTTIHGCASMSGMGEAEQYIGAIAGNVDEVNAEEVHDNVYYAKNMYGIDGVSYRGIAEGTDYHSLIGRAGVPTAFHTLTLTFEADDEVVDTVDCDYGDSLSENQIPKVPAKEGFFGEWKRKDFSKVTADEVVKAKYKRIETLIASDLTRKSGLPVLLAEGDFSKGDELTLEKQTVSLPLEKGRWQVTVPDDGEEVHTFRYMPSKKTNTVRIVSFGSGTDFRMLPTGKMGEYATFQVKGNEFSFGAVEYWEGAVGAIAFAILVIAVVGVTIFVIRFRKGKILLQRVVRFVKRKAEREKGME